MCKVFPTVVIVQDLEFQKGDVLTLIEEPSGVSFINSLVKYNTLHPTNIYIPQRNIVLHAHYFIMW